MIDLRCLFGWHVKVESDDYWLRKFCFTHICWRCGRTWRW